MPFRQILKFPTNSLPSRQFSKPQTVDCQSARFDLCFLSVREGGRNICVSPFRSFSMEIVTNFHKLSLFFDGNIIHFHKTSFHFPWKYLLLSISFSLFPMETIPSFLRFLSFFRLENVKFWKVYSFLSLLKILKFWKVYSFLSHLKILKFLWHFLLFSDVKLSKVSRFLFSNYKLP